MNNQQSGFTLMELIIVVIIIGIFAAIAAPKYFDLSHDAAESTNQANAKSIEAAILVVYVGELRNNPNTSLEAIANSVDGSYFYNGVLPVTSTGGNFIITADDATKTLTVSW